MRLLIELPETDHNDLKVFAAQKRMTMRQVILTSINIYMGRPDKEVKPIKRDRYDQFMDVFKRSGLTATAAARAMDIEEENFAALVDKIRPVTGDILVDAEIFLIKPE